MLQHSLATIKPELINDDLFIEKKLEVSILRLDKIHPSISGNKWFKLRFYLEEAGKKRKNILTFGGAYSNHILATAAACNELNIPCTGIIRGEKPSQLSTTLIEASELGMNLEFISREEYARKLIPSHILRDDNIIIPEGGYGKEGAKGASTIMELFTKSEFNYICCAVGTGTTLAGLLNAATSSTRLVGISVFKNNLQLESEIIQLLDRAKPFHLYHEFHFGGYAKYNEKLIQFMNEFYRKTGIPSDFVYTAKLFFGFTELAVENTFEPGSRILLIHSGGLQGNSSLRKGTLIF